MVTNSELQAFIDEKIKKLRSSQQHNGSWKYCFEGSLLTDAFVLIFLRTIDDKDENLIKTITNRLLSIQEKNGLWKLYQDETQGNVTATVQAYAALAYSGYISLEDDKMKKAEQFIKKNGGMKHVHFMTKWMLAVNGLYQWPVLFYFPFPFLLVPTSFPINFYSFSIYARIHFVPMLLTANKKYQITSKWTPSIPFITVKNPTSYTEWLSWDRDHQKYLQWFKQEFTKLSQLPAYFHRLGYQAAEQYMLKRIEKDGTLFSYTSATIFMVYALLAIGYKKDSPVIKNAVKGIKSLVCETENSTIIENSTSTVWDTALLSYSLQESGISFNDPMIQKANSYLLKKQHTKKADWSVHAPGVRPGGWGFSNINTNNPDNDDTSAALRSLTRAAYQYEKENSAWRLGAQYLLSMQNRDGGWGAFEKNVDQTLLTFIPIENAEDAVIDPSTPDLTGRAIEFLGNYAGLKEDHPQIKEAIKWLINNQNSNGSWYGRWGICYIYGTWAALTGLSAVGVSHLHPSIKKAKEWLKSIQNPDGGWGESCKSAEIKSYVPLKFSTPSQTAWAIDALLTNESPKSTDIDRGMKKLTNPSSFSKAALTYPTGLGLPGQYYIYYHSYNDIFPLLAAAHYKAKIAVSDLSTI
ncbi:terpene cyclase/mutase family protein [Metabacillus arenae]|uniref:Squalene--hopene cyclase n=1 Tax=Metabacillus arenae TaxID=2771434 RepID=A0A926RVL0_9BACI|nr:prenyltransferase/squalene oxidase repeat-containing protein [Metabacillus arenae]MBD1378976.1 squalene--hopene cyclase [Metabacillus arenae]